MAKFNNKMSDNIIESYEGGHVQEKELVEDWYNFLFSTKFEDTYYESAKEQINRFRTLTLKIIDKMGAEFVAKASFFARNYIGQRSGSQYVAAILSQYQFAGKRKYYANFPHRVDDVMEVYAAMDLLGYRKNNSVNRGFSDYLSSVNSYALGKYKMLGHDYNIYDVINITHAHSAAIDQLKAGILESPDTWEVAISTAEDKSAEWKRLVLENKLGYMALLRNLNNILAADGIDDNFISRYICPMLTNEAAIKKSLVFPYRIYVAYTNLKVHNFSVDLALDKAFKLAVNNMPALDGNTTIILDTSGSMTSRSSSNSQVTMKELGAVYAASILVKNPNALFIKFATDAKICKYNMNDNIFNIITQMQNEDGVGFGTNIYKAFNLLSDQSPQDRLFVISDMQIMSPSHNYSWWNDINGISDKNSIDSFKEYCKTYNPNCQCYSFDLSNYRTQLEGNKNNIHLLTTLNDQVYKFISLLESGESLIDYIEDFSYFE